MWGPTGKGAMQKTLKYIFSKARNPICKHGFQWNPVFSYTKHLPWLIALHWISDQVCGENFQVYSGRAVTDITAFLGSKLCSVTESKCFLHFQRMRFGLLSGTLEFISRTNSVLWRTRSLWVVCPHCPALVGDPREGLCPGVLSGTRAIPKVWPNTA